MEPSHPSDYPRATERSVKDFLDLAGVEVADVVETRPGVVRVMMIGVTHADRLDHQRRVLAAIPLRFDPPHWSAHPGGAIDGESDDMWVTVGDSGLDWYDAATGKNYPELLREYGVPTD